MAWETRNGRGAYYTRSRRQGRRVVREYLGKGMVAELAAVLDARDQAERREKRQALARERERLEAADEPLAELCRLTDLLARGALLAAGYHQHARGHWRRRRGGRAG
jgi:hypothetical protein